MGSIVDSVAPSVVVRGSHLLLAGGVWPASTGDPASWSVAYQDAALGRVYGEPPAVGRVTISADTYEAALDLDAALVPDVGYSLQPPPDALPKNFTAKRSAGAAEGTQDARLLDIDAPLIRADGRGGDYRTGGAGDRVLTGGIATVIKAIWHVLLRDASPLQWKAAAPVRVVEEEQRLGRAVTAVAYVQRARVYLTRDGDHMLVSVQAQTELGPIDDQRRV